MIREYVEGHKFNGVRWAKTPFGNNKVCFVRGVIRHDGIDEGFASWGKSQHEAQAEFNTFLHAECICSKGIDANKCPIHGDGDRYRRLFKRELSKIRGIK